MEREIHFSLSTLKKNNSHFFFLIRSRRTFIVRMSSSYFTRSLSVCVSPDFLRAAFANFNARSFFSKILDLFERRARVFSRRNCAGKFWENFLSFRDREKIFLLLFSRYRSILR